MKNEYDLVNEAVEAWRLNRGVGTMYLPLNYNPYTIVYILIFKLLNKDSSTRIMLVVSNFDERKQLIENLCHTEDEDFNALIKRNIDDGHLRIFTESFLAKGNYYIGWSLVICINIDKLSLNLVNVISKSTFKAVLLNKHLSTSDTAVLHEKCPPLDVFKASEVLLARTNTPVEEIRVGIDITDDEIIKELNIRDEYIKTSLAIFGSFDLLKEGFQGNALVNMSAQDVCDRIARENGWNEHLDMSSEINRQIDKLYNPNELRERASITYNVVRERNQLITDYAGKLEAILKILNDNPDKKFLIISKRAEFAKTITDYLNLHSQTQICADYHDKLDPIEALDEYGNIVTYKSGAQKGKVKLMGAQAQCTRNVNLFECNKIRALSTNSAPNKNLSIQVDGVIITSPACSTISEYLYRLKDMYIKGDKLLLYTIYCNNTAEEKKLSNQVNENHTINNQNEKNIVLDESCGIIIC